jgi:hypothetical protein
MTKEELEAIRDEPTMANCRALLAYVDELIHERDKLNQHRLAHHNAIIEISKLRGVVEKADAWLAAHDHDIPWEWTSQREAYRTARAGLEKP